jgi:hypothetical protein
MTPSSRCPEDLGGRVQTTNSFFLEAATVAVYILLLWLPGGVAGVAAGLRGWVLAASAPLITYTIAGLFGPWLSMVGIRWSVLAFLAATTVVTLLFGGARWLAVRRRRSLQPQERPSAESKTIGLPSAEPTITPLWKPSANFAVAATVLAAAAIGVYVFARAAKGLSAIPQDWDALFHANGIRWIAETGDGGLFGMSHVNWYEKAPGIFYPNAYHLIGALVYKVTGAPIPVVLDAHTAIIPGMLALTLAAMIRHMRGRAVTAGCTALVVASATSTTYDTLWRGPLLPYATGLVLTPVVAILLVRFLDQPHIDTGMVFTGSVLGLLAVHSSTLFGALLFLLPLLAQHWWERPRRIGRDLLRLVPAAVLGLVVASAQLFGALNSYNALPTFSWPAEFTVSHSVGSLLTFQHLGPYPQMWLAVGLWIGLLTLRRLGALRWIGGAALLLGALFVITASFNTELVKSITRPWWNDQWRLIALATLPLCVIAGHGLAVIQRCLGTALARLGGRRVRPAVSVVAAPVAGLLVLGALGLLADGFYVHRNVSTVAAAYADGPAVNHGKYAAMRWLGSVVKPGERVMNDRNDGTAWMYAIVGVRSVVGHYDGTWIGPDAALLADSFNSYDDNPAVREAVARENIRYVMIGRGFIREYFRRQPGLRDLDGAAFLEKVYENEDAVVYKLRPAAGT